MRADGQRLDGFQTVLKDGRDHTVTIDLPRDEGGEDLGPSALELCVMSLAGCISTIFALIAAKRRLMVGTTSIGLEATRAQDSPTITSVRGELRVTTDAPLAEVNAALRLTLRSCPVGVIFERANIPVHVRAVVTRPASGAVPVPAR